MNANIASVLELFSGHGHDMDFEDSGPETYSDFVFAPLEMERPVV